MKITRLLFGLLVVLLACCTPSFAAISVLQTAVGSVASGTTFTIVLPSNVTAGSLIWVGTLQFALASGAGVSTVKDNVNNTNFTQAINDAVTGGRDTGYIYYFPSSASGAMTITVTGNANSSFCAGVAMEISGVDTLDATASGDTSGGSSTNVVSGTYSTTTANEILTAYPFNADGTNYTYTNQTGYTNVAAGPGSGMSDGAEYQVVSSTQSSITTAFTANTAATTHGIIVATFKLGGGGSPSPPRLTLLGVGM